MAKSFQEALNQVIDSATSSKAPSGGSAVAQQKAVDKVFAPVINPVKVEAQNIARTDAVHNFTGSLLQNMHSGGTTPTTLGNPISDNLGLPSFTSQYNAISEQNKVLGTATAQANARTNVMDTFRNTRDSGTGVDLTELTKQQGGSALDSAIAQLTKNKNTAKATIRGADWNVTNPTNPEAESAKSRLPGINSALASLTNAKDVSDLRRFMALSNEKDFAQYQMAGKFVDSGRTKKDPVTNYVAFAQTNPTPEQMKGGASHGKEYLAKLRTMSDDEIGVYNYLIGKGRTADAERFLEILENDLVVDGEVQPGLTTRRGMEMGQQLADSTSPVAKVVAGSMKINAGVDRFLGGVRQSFTDEVLPNTEWNVASAEYRELVMERAKNATGADKVAANLELVASDLLENIGNQAIPMILSFATAGILSGLGASAGVTNALTRVANAAPMGVSAAGNDYAQEVASGRDPEQAKMHAYLTGLSETGLGYLLNGIGAVGGVITGKSVAKVAEGMTHVIPRLATKFALEGMGEAIEEGSQDLLSPLLASLCYGDEFKGWSAEDIGNAAYSALLGFLSTGAMNGLHIVATDAAVTREGDKLKTTLSKDAIKQIIDYGMAKEKGSAAHTAATVLQTELSKGKDITAYQLGTVYADATVQANAREVDTEARKTVGKVSSELMAAELEAAKKKAETTRNLMTAMTKAGMEENEVQLKTPLFEKLLSGEKLTPAEANTLGSSERVRKAVKALTNTKITATGKEFLPAVYDAFANPKPAKATAKKTATKTAAKTNAPAQTATAPQQTEAAPAPASSAVRVTDAMAKAGASDATVARVFETLTKLDNGETVSNNDIVSKLGVKDPEVRAIIKELTGVEIPASVKNASEFKRAVRAAFAKTETAANGGTTNGNRPEEATQQRQTAETAVGNTDTVPSAAPERAVDVSGREETQSAGEDVSRGDGNNATAERRGNETTPTGGGTSGRQLAGGRVDARRVIPQASKNSKVIIRETPERYSNLGNAHGVTKVTVFSADSADGFVELANGMKVGGQNIFHYDTNTGEISVSDTSPYAERDQLFMHEMMEQANAQGKINPVAIYTKVFNSHKGDERSQNMMRMLVEGYAPGYQNLPQTERLAERNAAIKEIVCDSAGFVNNLAYFKNVLLKERIQAEDIELVDTLLGEIRAELEATVPDMLFKRGEFDVYDWRSGKPRAVNAAPAQNTESKAETPAPKNKRGGKKSYSSPADPDAFSYAPAFYSKLEQVVQDKKTPNKIAAPALISFLKGKGVKAEELRWSELDVLLDGRPSITKDELLQWVRFSQLEIKEKTRTASAAYGGEREVAVDTILDLIEDEKIESPEMVETFLSANSRYKKASDNIDRLQREIAELDGNGDVFDSMDEDDSYLILDDAYFEDDDYTPEQKRVRAELDEAWSEYWAAAEGIDSVSKSILSQFPMPERTKFGTYKTDGGTNYREIEFIVPQLEDSYSAYAHWDGDEGVFAHTRLQDFTDTTGAKVLFVEEIQSDWANDIRKAKKRRDELLASPIEGAEAVSEDDPFYNMPFGDDYYQFVLKRLIRMAAEEGYDKIAWTTPDMQVERWAEDYRGGYETLYGRQIPSFLKKYIKQWGGQISESVLDAGDSAHYPSGASVDNEPFHLYDVFPAVDGNGYLVSFVDDITGEIRTYESNAQSEDEAVAETESLARADAEANLAWWNEDGHNGLYAVPSIQITPAMRQAVLYEGQPQYSSLADPEAFAPTYFSKIEQTLSNPIKNVNPEKIKPDVLLKRLTDAGVSADEMKWSGLPQALEGRQTISQAEALEIVKADRLQLEEKPRTTYDVPADLGIKPNPEYEAGSNQKSKELGDALEKFRDEVWTPAFGNSLPMPEISKPGSWANLETYVARNINDVLANSTEMAQYMQAKRNLIAELDRSDFASEYGGSGATAVEHIDFVLRNQSADEITNDWNWDWDWDDALDDYIDMKSELSNLADDLLSGNAMRSLSQKGQRIHQSIAEAAAAMDKMERDMWGRTPNEKTNFLQYAHQGIENYREIEFLMPNSNYTNNAMQMHWRNQSPYAQNLSDSGVVAHARFGETTAADGGRVLMVEEIQSDWANALRDAEGSRFPNLEFTQMDDGTWAITGAFFSEPVLTPEPIRGETRKEAEAQLEAFLNSVPEDEWGDYIEEGDTSLFSPESQHEEMPFGDDYYKYVLKNMLRIAAEEGFDYVAWAPPETHERRWSRKYLGGYEKVYGRDLPNFAKKYVKAWGSGVGVLDLPNLRQTAVQDTSDYSTYYKVKTNEGDLFVKENSPQDAVKCADIWGNADKKHPDFKATSAEEVTVPDLGVKVLGVRVTPEMKNSVLEKGQPQFSFVANADAFRNAMVNDGNVVQTKDFVAIRSLSLRSLLSVFKSDNFVMPSFAVTRLSQPEAMGAALDFGPASIFFPYDTVSPEQGNASMYSGDAGTPSMYPYMTRLLEGEDATNVLPDMIEAGNNVNPVTDIFDLRRAAVQPINSNEEMHASEGRIGSGDEFFAVSEELDEELQYAMDEIDDANPGLLDEDPEAISRVLGELARSGATDVAQFFAERGLDIEPETARTIRALLKAVRTYDTPYFEAKAERLVPISEGAVALLPDNVPEGARLEEYVKAINSLEAHGVKVAYYEEGNEESREHAIQMLAKSGTLPTFSSAADSAPFKKWLNDKRGSRHTISDLQEENRKGFRKKRPDAVRIPKKDLVDGLTSRDIQTMINSGATPDAVIDDLLSAAADGAFSHMEYKDEKAIKDAKNTIKTLGWEGALGQFESEIEKGVVSKKNTALGITLYNNAANKGDYVQCVSIATLMCKNATAAGQALQAMNILNKLGPDGRMYALERSIETIAREMREKYKLDKSIELDEYLLDDYREALISKNPDQIDAAWKAIAQAIGAQLPANWKEQLTSWRYLAMLGNPRTHIRNIVGNLGFAPVRLAKQVVKAGLERAFIGEAGTEGRTTAVLNPTSMADIQRITAANKDFENVVGIIKNGDRYDERRDDIQNARTIFNIKGHEIKLLEWLREKNGNALDLEDMWFSRFAYAEALASYLKANDISGEDFYNGNLEGDTKLKAQKFAILEAQKATYRDLNSFSDAITKLGRIGKDPDAGLWEKGAGMFIEGVLPFKKTPANILVRAVEYSPAEIIPILAHDISALRKGTITTADMLEHISSGLTGTGIAVLGYFLARKGILHGADDDDDKQSGFDKLAGTQTWSIDVGEDKNVTIDWLAPEVMPLFVGAAAYKMIQTKYFEEGHAAPGAVYEAGMSAISSLVDPMLSLSMLSSVNDMLEGMAFAQQGSYLQSLIASAASSYVQQFVPTLFGQIERILETNRQSTYLDRNSDVPTSLQSTLGRVLNKIPGKPEYNQIEYIDAWGRTQESGDVFNRVISNMVLPGYVTADRDTPVDAELQRLYDLDPETYDVLPKKPDSKHQIPTTNEGKEKTYMSAEEYTVYAKTRGSVSLNGVTALLASAWYKSASDDLRAKAISTIYSNAADIADEEIRKMRGLDAKSGNMAEARSAGMSVQSYAIAKTIYDSTLTPRGYEPTASGGTPSWAKALAILDAKSLSNAEKVAYLNATSDRKEQFETVADARKYFEAQQDRAKSK